MYKRIRDGLFDPKKVVDYIHDKWYYPVLTLLIFALVLLIPDIVSVMQYEIEYDTKTELISDFKGESLPYKIENGELKKLDSSSDFVKVEDTYAICFLDGTITTTSSNGVSSYSGYVIHFDQDGVYLEVVSFRLKIMDYTAYPSLEGFEFNNLTKGQNDSWNIIFQTISDLYDSYKPTLLVATIFTSLFSNISVLILVALLYALGNLIRLHNLIKFKEMLVMNIYYLVPFVIGTLIDGIFNINFVFIIGVIISLIYTNIGQIEVWKRVYGHHTEG